MEVYASGFAEHQGGFDIVRKLLVDGFKHFF
jgi:hypothetical protein